MYLRAASSSPWTEATRLKNSYLWVYAADWQYWYDYWVGSQVYGEIIEGNQEKNRNNSHLTDLKTKLDLRGCTRSPSIHKALTNIYNYTVSGELVKVDGRASRSFPS